MNNIEKIDQNEEQCDIRKRSISRETRGSWQAFHLLAKKSFYTPNLFFKSPDNHDGAFKNHFELIGQSNYTFIDMLRKKSYHHSKIIS